MTTRGRVSDEEGSVLGKRGEMNRRVKDYASSGESLKCIGELVAPARGVYELTGMELPDRGISEITTMGHLLKECTT